LPRRPPGNASDYVQIAQQLFACIHAFRIVFFDFTPGSQKQLRTIDNAVLYVAWTFTPGVINQPDFAGAELMAGNLIRKTFTGKFIGPRNRHEVLHSRMRADLSKSNIFLYGFGQLAYECQTTGYPGLASVETPGEIVHAHFQTAMQFGKQPALFQRRFTFCGSKGSVQNQSLGFRHIPNRCLDRVSAQFP